jgi:hypothetical protein
MSASVDPVAWGNFTLGFLYDLAAALRGQRVLEVFAGNGLMAASLASRGVQITATSLFSGHDGHERGLHHPVLEVDAVTAVTTYGADCDVLLMSWPTATRAAAACVAAWGTQRDIVFIGEVTDHACGHLGGCASDDFFELTDIQSRFLSYHPGNMLDHALVLRATVALVETYAGVLFSGRSIPVSW